MRIINLNKIETNQNEVNVYDGVVDSPVETDADFLCLDCGLDGVLFIEKQDGICHSGRFKTSCKEHYWCSECEEMFIDIDSSDYKNNKAVVEYKKTR
ncbi:MULTISPECIES: hypothetical protein [unclassified Gammaproteobacteria]|uniref:hypothetical protein n=1 Tax=unclassified Gammaproteobacteria TaxID=33811 RepID=UPI000B4145F0|nr:MULTISPECIES: hypothetical protein [unclassified Gammaproteobacteria]GFO72788.1 hypothetical protein BJAS_P3287 [Bathymodiolus japonicus methanotrophic gill symbiont]